MQLRTIAVAAAASVAMCAACAPTPSAATTPRPIRVVAKTRTDRGPVLAGSRVLWARQGYSKATIGTATRRSRRTAVTIETPSYADDMFLYDLAASPRRAAYGASEEYFEIRDSFPRAYFYGALRPSGADHQSLGRCHDLDNCFFYTTPHVEASGDTVAWGPFRDGSDDRSSHNILVKDFDPKTGPGAIVKARDVNDFRLAGRYLLVRPRADAGDLVLLNWRANRVVRTLPLPRYLSAFDLDDRGRVAVAWGGGGARMAFGLYDTNGRLHRVAAAGSTSGADIYTARGRLAISRTLSRKGKQFLDWRVMTVRGRTLAAMRPPKSSDLTDFDGNCLAWTRSSRSIYVAAVGRAPRSSICRR